MMETSRGCTQLAVLSGALVRAVLCVSKCFFFFFEHSFHNVCLFGFVDICKEDLILSSHHAFIWNTTATPLSLFFLLHLSANILNIINGVILALPSAKPVSCTTHHLSFKTEWLLHQTSSTPLVLYVKIVFKCKG